MPSQFQIRRAADVVRHGGVIAYPTEAVYGLGCDPDDAAAVRRLLAIKQRDPDQGLIVIGADFDQLAGYFAPLNTADRRRLTKSRPGPVTWLVPASASAPVWITGRHATIAARITTHPVARELCRVWGHALVSTSANRSGAEPARDAHAVRRMLGDDVDYILSGPVGVLDRPTPIRDLATGQILRH